MASSMTNDFAYQLQNDEYIEHVSHLSQSFVWLDRLLYYYPIYVPISPSLDRRSKYLSISMIVFLLICTTTYGVIGPVQFWMDTPVKFSNILTFRINETLQDVLTMIARYISIYYFYYKFKYPWHSTINSFNGYNASIQFNAKKKKQQRIYIKSTKIMMIFGLFSTNAAMVTFMITSEDSIVPGIYKFWFILLTILNIIFIYIPFLAIYSIHGAICLKYQYYISILSEMLKEGDDNHDIELDDIVNKYKLLYDSLQTEYSFSFNLCIKIYFCVNVLIIWVWWFAFTKQRFFLFLIPIPGYFVVIIMYSLPALFMNEAYEEFYDELWKYGKKCISKKVSNNDIAINNNISYNKHYYNHLSQYIKEFPLTTEIAGFMVTKKSVLTFSVGFVISQYVAYALTDDINPY